MDAPTAKLTVSLILLEPLAVKPDVPLEPTAVQLSLVILAGNKSETLAPTTLDGPLFATTIVYVVNDPGMAEATPSVLVIERSPVGFNISVSVAELFPLL